MATTAWCNIVARCGKQSGYWNVEVRMTRAEFVAWAVPAYIAWLEANSGSQPSVDRIKQDGHYEIGNLRILEMVENGRRAAKNKNHHAPAGTAWCGGHKAYLAITEFSPAPSRPPLGVSNYCRACHRAGYHRRKRK